MQWSQRAQEAYRAYRDCPRPRSLRRAAGLYYHGDPDTEPSIGELRQFKEWSRLLGWVSRLECELSAVSDRRFYSTAGRYGEAIRSDESREPSEARR